MALSYALTEFLMGEWISVLARLQMRFTLAFFFLLFAFYGRRKMLMKMKNRTFYAVMPCPEDVAKVMSFINIYAGGLKVSFHV